jgi:hypothetical protein
MVYSFTVLFQLDAMSLINRRFRPKVLVPFNYLRAYVSAI